MSPVEIRISLIRAGIRQADIAKKTGVSRALISAVLCGLNRSLRAEQAIADAIGRPLSEVFPDRCPHCGSRVGATEAVAS